MWGGNPFYFRIFMLNLSVSVDLTGLLHAAPYPLVEEVARSLVLTAVLVAAGGLAAGLGAAGEVFQLLGISLLF